MAVTVTHSTPADGTFSTAGALAWDDNHVLTGLGTAAEYDVGTSANNVVQLDGTGKLPAVDGSQLTGIATGAAGSDTQIQFNDGGSFGSDSGLTFNKTNKALTLGGATVTASAPVLNLSQTWNNGAVTFTGLKANFTDTASASASLLMDLQVGGGSKFNITKGGRLVWPNVVGSGNTNYIDGGFDQFRMDFFVRGVVRASIGSGNDFTIGGDAILRRRAAANLCLGAADAAAPVAQTLSVQSVVAGTSNTAGANFTITGSQGTGTGAGGSIIFQVAPAGSSGTAQNALARRFAIVGAGSVVVGDGSSALATTATDGFLYVPTCAGTPTGTPTTQTGSAPIVVDTTNNKLYFYSGGSWRDAGP